MKTINNTLFPLIILCGILFMISCNSPKKEGIEHVVYMKSDDVLLQSPFIEQIKWIFLETTEGSLIGSVPELRVTDRNIYLIDKGWRSSNQIHRFNHSGKFLNTIGSVGRGPNEYLGIADVAILKNGNIELFSPPGITRYLFSEEGLCLERKEYEHNAQKVARQDGTYWIYKGYGNGDRPERLIRIDTLGVELGGYLPSEAKVLSIGEQWSVFTQNNGRLFLRESMNAYVYELSAKSVDPVYWFDFGVLNVPKEYYEFGDPFAAIGLLEKRPYITIDAFMENNKYAVVQATVQREEAPRMIIGIKEKQARSNKWHWFDCLYNCQQGGTNALFFANLVLTDNSKLYCAIEAERVLALDASLKASLFPNGELDNVREDDNHIILVIQLKSK